MKRRGFKSAAAFLLVALLPSTLEAQRNAGQANGAQQEGAPASEVAGIPITSQVVVDSCDRCHEQSDDGTMTRLSFMRKTPEGWQQSIRRMVTLNEVDLDPSTAREIVRYLSDRHGVAPEELRPGRFEVERRMIEHTYDADATVAFTCIQCHSLGRVITQRRTAEEWDLLMAMHRGYYPLSDSQGFLRRGPPDPDATDTRHPMDKAVSHLSDAYPLRTASWTAWSATMRAPQLQGTWGLRGHDPGNGPLFGTVEIGAGNSESEFSTTARYVNPRTGQRVERTGQSLVYTGYQWRGRSFEGRDESKALREVMMVERGWTEMTGRWFRGDYDELGPDVRLVRVQGATVLGLYPTSIRQGSSARIEVHGVGLPTGIGSDALDLGPGVTVANVTSSDGTVISAQVSVASDAAAGGRDVFIAGIPSPDPLVVFATVDRVVVTPEAGMARVGGGGSFPKGLAQFEARGFSDGPDDEPDTEDDLDLGQLDVTWTMEEYAAAFGDDDIEFVGELNQDGLFVPAIDGPNPDRAGQRNNVGDVWVVATYNGPGGNAVKGRSHLLVTVPLYLRWEPWRMGQPVS